MLQKTEKKGNRENDNKQVPQLSGSVLTVRLLYEVHLPAWESSMFEYSFECNKGYDSDQVWFYVIGLLVNG